MKDKLPPDEAAQSGRASLPRQSTPLPAGEPKPRRLRRKVTETPIEGVRIATYHEMSGQRSVAPCDNTMHAAVESLESSVRKGRCDNTMHAAVENLDSSVKGRTLTKGASLSNGLLSTPVGTKERGPNDTTTSPSLWTNKTPEEIVEFYRHLGPDWRNVFPKTDLVYSPNSPWYNKEVVPGSGIPVITNMSREPVGVYRSTLKRRTFEFNNSSEFRSQNHHSAQSDPRVSLSYGLNHSPTTRLGYHPSQYSSNYSSSTSTSLISKTRHIFNSSVAMVTSTVSMVTRLFTLVTTLLSLVWHWRGNHSNQTSQYEGVDTVDNGYHTRQRTVNYEYKTGAKRSSMNHRAMAARGSLSSWSQAVVTRLYKLNSWLIETNSWLFWFKDQRAGSSPEDRRGRYVKFAVVAFVLLLFGVSIGMKWIQSKDSNL